MGRDPVPPVLLGETCDAGLSLSVRFLRCRHTVELVATAIPLSPELDMDQVGHRLRCTGCGRRGGHTVYPDPRGWVRYVRAQGWRHREPWFAPMISLDPEADGSRG